MKKMVMVLTALCLPTVASAAPLAYPGSSWGMLQTPVTSKSGTPEGGNWTYTGRVTQGVDWVEVNNWTLDTYITVGLSVDTKGFDYNNKVTPGVGIKMSHPIPHGVLEIGAQVINETHFGDKYIIGNRSDTGVQAYVSYWVGWGK